MFKSIKQKIDRWAINAAAASLPKPCPDPAQAGELEAILEDPNFFNPPSIIPSLEFTNRWEFQFESAVKLCCPENNRVHGWFFRAGNNWRERPLTILIHGWNAETQYKMFLPSLGRRLQRAGINAMAFELPLHTHRRPKPPHPVRDFISDHVPTMLQATRQSIADLHALVQWAKNEGCPKVGCWGFSLGGWLGGLYGTVTPAADAIVLTIPVTSMSDAIRDLAFCHPIRAAMEVVPLRTDFLDLENRKLLVNPKNLLLQEGGYDSFVKRSTYERLAGKWGIQDWVILKESHISSLVSRHSMKQGTLWLNDHLT